MQKHRTKIGAISSVFLICALTGCNSASSNSTSSAPSTPGTPDTITFSPATLMLNNPINGTTNAVQQLRLSMTATNALGQTIIPSASNPIHVDVYGAPNGIITPSSILVESNTLTLNYSGASFPNNITINAWISDSTNNGAAIGVTQALMQNTPPTCSYASQSYQVALVSTLPNALQIQAAVGYPESSAASHLAPYTLDTGSLGVIVPVSELAANANVIGPGASGVKYYDSSGNTYSGNYYLAPVSIQIKGGGVVQTQPILVLGINKADCSGPSTSACYSNPPPLPNLHYMGVGFNRNGTTTGDLFDSPTANAFLHLTNAQNGSNITPGYYLTPSVESISGAGLVLGINDTTNYNMINLTPNAAVPGDFNAQPGCFSFPGLASPNSFCGTALLDVGIDEMFIDLPESQWPTGSSTNGRVPLGVAMSIAMGSPAAMAYNFTVESNPPPGSPAPAYVQWINTTTASGQIFVNTGRRPLYKYNYLYNGQCGQVGFKAI